MYKKEVNFPVFSPFLTHLSHFVLNLTFCSVLRRRMCSLSILLQSEMSVKISDTFSPLRTPFCELTTIEFSICTLNHIILSFIYFPFFLQIVLWVLDLLCCLWSLYVQTTLKCIALHTHPLHILCFFITCHIFPD